MENDFAATARSINKKEEVVDEPFLELRKFAPKASIDFGSCTLGTTRTAILRVANVQPRDQTLVVDRIPTEKGFSVCDVTFTIPACNSLFQIPISWTPVQVGPCAATLHLLWEKCRLSVSLSGRAEEIPKRHQKTARQPCNLKRGVKIETQSNGIAEKSLRVGSMRPQSASLSSSSSLTQKSMKKVATGTGITAANAIVSASASTSQIQQSATRNVLSDLRDKQSKDVKKNREKSAQKRKQSSISTQTMEEQEWIQRRHKLHALKMEQLEQERVLIADQKRQRLNWLQLLPIDVTTIRSEIQRIETQFVNCCSKESRRRSMDGLKEVSFTYFNCDKIEWLLKWCQAVCSTYGIAIENFNFCFNAVDQSEIIFKLLVNFYSRPPVALQDLFPRIDVHSLLQRNAHTTPEPPHAHVDTIEEGKAWTVTFTQASSSHNINDERETCTPINEHETIARVAHLCSKLLSSLKKMEKKYAATKIQSLVKKRFQRKRYLALKFTAQQLQNIFRMQLQRSSMSCTYWTNINVQAIARTTGMAHHMSKQQFCASLLQKQAQMTSFRWQFNNRREQALFLQAKRRALQHHEKLHRLRKCASTLYGSLSTKLEQMRFMYRRRQILNLQSVSRRQKIVARHNRAKLLSSELQSSARQTISVFDFARKNNAALSCQIFIKLAVEQAKLRSSRDASLKLQRIKRTSSHRMHIECQRRSIRVIQRVFQNYLSGQQILQGCTQLQTITRMSQTTSSFGQQVCVFPTIQSLSLERCDFQEFAALRITACTLQTAARSIAQIKQFTKLQSATLATRSIISCQSIFRSSLSQEQNFQAIILERQTKLHYAAREIQRYFRGYLVRKNNIDKLNEIAKRVAYLSSTADERAQLGFRTRAALKVLLGSKQMSKIQIACESLDATTLYSIQCRESLVKEGAVPILFTCIKTCNRSQPHLQLIKHALNILIHLAQNAYTANAVFETNDSIVTLVELLQMYRDKEEIFSRTLEVLRLLCNLNTKTLKRIKNTKNVVLRLRNIAKLMEAKYQMEKTLAKSLQLEKGSKKSATIPSARFRASESMVNSFESLVSLIAKLDE